MYQYMRKGREGMKLRLLTIYSSALMISFCQFCKFSSNMLSQERNRYFEDESSCRPQFWDVNRRCWILRKVVSTGKMLVSRFWMGHALDSGLCGSSFRNLCGPSHLVCLSTEFVSLESRFTIPTAPDPRIRRYGTLENQIRKISPLKS